MSEDSALFLVRIWPQRPGFKATVRLASAEHTYQFDEPSKLARHLSELAQAVAPKRLASDDCGPPTCLDGASRGHQARGPA